MSALLCVLACVSEVCRFVGCSSMLPCAVLCAALCNRSSLELAAVLSGQGVAWVQLRGHQRSVQRSRTV